MPDRPRGLARPARDVSRRHDIVKLARYGTGSLIATACSYLTFVVLYGIVGTTAGVATFFGWLAGAVPNYWLNRTWTWRRRGRPDMRREVIPYIAIIVGTLILAVVVTDATSAAISGIVSSRAWRTFVVGAAFLGVYLVVFALRFLLLDRMFVSASRGDTDHRLDMPEHAEIEEVT